MYKYRALYLIDTFGLATLHTSFQIKLEQLRAIKWNFGNVPFVEKRMAME